MKKLLLLLTLIIAIAFRIYNQKSHKGSLRVLISPDNKPFTYIDTNKNEITGFEIDIVREIARRMKRELKIICLDFIGITAALKNNVGDIAISSINPTEKRRKSVLFSRSYFESGIAIISKDENISNIEEWIGDNSLASQLSSSTSIALSEYINNIKDAKMKIIEFTVVPSMIEALKNDIVKGVAIDRSTAIKICEEHPRYRLYEIDYKKQEFAIAGRSRKTINSINEILESMKKDGTLENLKNKWKVS